jgi:hypothetical protein
MVLVTTHKTTNVFPHHFWDGEVFAKGRSERIIPTGKHRRLKKYNIVTEGKSTRGQAKIK